MDLRTSRRPEPDGADFLQTVTCFGPPVLPGGSGLRRHFLSEGPRRYPLRFQSMRCAFLLSTASPYYLQRKDWQLSLSLIYSVAHPVQSTQNNRLTALSSCPSWISETPPSSSDRVNHTLRHAPVDSCGVRLTRLRKVQTQERICWIEALPAVLRCLQDTKGDPGPEGPQGPIGPIGPVGPAAVPYVFPFLNTAWVVGAPNYTITILGTVHGKGVAPEVQVQQANGTDYYPISPGIVHIDSITGNITLEVDASLASQLFSGRVVIE